jgi:hypothetical protein
MVQPGDVLLVHGPSVVSWAIRFLDRSEVNHAAIAVDDESLAEAAWMGLRFVSLDSCVAGNNYVLVRRSDVADTAPVVTVANDYVNSGVPYAYQQVLLLAVLCATRAVPLPMVAKRFVRRALDGAADALNAKIDRDGTTLMICSEFVYRCYAETDPPHLLVTDLALEAAADGSEFTFVDDWARDHEEAIVAEAEAEAEADAAAVAVAGAGPAPEDLALLEADIAEYAAQVAALDPEAAEIAVEHGAEVAAVAAVADQPSDDELARALVRFSASLESAGLAAAGDDVAQPAGVGLDVGLGALKGLLSTRTNPNFVTPGDLLRSGALHAVETLRRD